MPLVRWDSLRNVSILQDRINHLFNDAFPSPKFFDDDINMSLWRPVVDIFDRDQHLVIQVELPGLEKEDVSVEVKGSILTLKGERVADNTIRDDQYYRRERSFGAFHRSFTLPSGIDPDHVIARFKNGILEIELSKPVEEKPKKISVDVE